MPTVAIIRHEDQGRRLHYLGRGFTTADLIIRSEGNREFADFQGRFERRIRQLRNLLQFTDLASFQHGDRETIPKKEPI